MSTVDRPPTEPAERPPAPVSPAVSSNDPFPIRAARSAHADLLAIVADRAKVEVEIDAARFSSDQAADQEYHRARQALADKFTAEKAAARQEDDVARRTISDVATKGEAEAKAEFSQASRRIAAGFEAVRERARTELARNKTAAIAAAEVSDRAAAAAFGEERKPIDQARQIAASMRGRFAAVFEAYRIFGVAESNPSPSRETYRSEDPVNEIFDRLGKIEPPLALLESLWIPRAMKGKRSLWIFVVSFLLVIYPAVVVLDWMWGAVLAVSLTALLGFGLRTWLFRVAKAQVERLYIPGTQALADAKGLAAHCLNGAEARLAAEKTRIAQVRDDALLKAKEKHAKTISSGEELRDEQLRGINHVFNHKTQEIQAARQSALTEAAERYEQRSTEVRTQNETASRRLDEKYQAVKEKIRVRYVTAWDAMAARWREGLARVGSVLDTASAEVAAISPRWDDPSWDARPPASRAPSIVRLGEVRVAIDDLPGGMPSDERLRDGTPTAFTFPALMAFPECGNLLIEAPAAGRDAALASLRAAMLRILTTLPPGQVRFTIVDPIGIGRNFGAFMHLADVDPVLVGGQVCTEPRQIEDRLADLSAHLEKVTQKYLRDEYPSLGAYNAAAGEVAEPYRVLVIADFPVNIDEKAAARLLGVIARGIPCGVLTLIAVDSDKPLPAGVTREALGLHAEHLAWDGARLRWADPDLGRYPLELDALPSPDAANRLIRRAGELARRAKRVEVAFDFIAPTDDAWWTADSRAGVDVPLGKAGATKRQHLALGQGTSQHVLIAGRTGSGKSTLLHALIVNLALRYAPDEIEMYLIDFKKGVEFKVYASHNLPHASVVAIESEREFGVSVLQRLDDEMRIRGERFRDAGVQDLNGYRNAPGTPPLPRSLLIVDEFQEFFVEDDKVAAEAARLLDRLVRQGRAFGVHVLLGSQTLGGAYALARSTLGQMAVRIALQCSDADAPLILGESNTAARLLSRPGEAVYNDANGQVEANQFFQVVWLSDDRREAYLDRLAELARVRPPVLDRQMIVFEGDAPADLARNPELAPLLALDAWAASPRSALAWLGDPVAIKEPTSARFRRQGGNHLLVVGQDAGAARGVLAASILSLAAQYPPAADVSARSGARFVVLDGTPEDEPDAEALARLASALPHPVEAGGMSDVARLLGNVAADLERRKSGDLDGPEVFLVIHDLARFRDLRRRADDFGFSRRDDENASPAEQLVDILRDGSALGVHVLSWCDSVNNLNRAFDHQVLRDFEMRVLFQMSQTDSAHLLDSPAASKLGANRALFFSEDQNRLEKFRPYGVPDGAWLEQVMGRLAQRSQ